jgi:hypothetical protein
MPILRRRTNSDTTTQPAGSAAVPSQRDTQEGTTTAQTAASQGQASGATGAGAAPAQAEPRQAVAAEARPETRPEATRRNYGLAGTLMILSGLLTFFIGITGVIRGVFFNNVATFPFYYSVRSRGITLLVIGAVAFVVGIALLIRMHWARHVATVVAVINAVANFMFLPFYPFWSIIVLALNIVIIWELEKDSVRQVATLGRLARHGPAMPRPAGCRSLYLAREGGGLPS